MNIYTNGGKRVLDLFLTLAALLLLAPVFALIALTLAFSMGRPLLFKQQRPGLLGHPFILRKFRTMLDTRDRQGEPLPDSERLTRLGAWLRRSSLDELPELLNVLRGEMSLVGPRPLLMRYLERYSPEQSRRHNVRPGLTGWAQINGRNALTWEQKLRLDLWYVEHCGFWLDLKILFQTLWKVLKREGISAEGSATMPEFMGSPAEGPNGRLGDESEGHGA